MGESGSEEVLPSSTIGIGTVPSFSPNFSFNLFRKPNIDVRLVFVIAPPTETPPLLLFDDDDDDVADGDDVFASLPPKFRSKLAPPPIPFFSAPKTFDFDCDDESSASSSSL